MQRLDLATNDYESVLQYVVDKRRTDYSRKKAPERRLNAAKQAFERLTVIALRSQNPLRLLT